MVCIRKQNCNGQTKTIPTGKYLTPFLPLKEFCDLKQNIFWSKIFLGLVFPFSKKLVKIMLQKGVRLVNMSIKGCFTCNFDLSCYLFDYVIYARGLKVSVSDTNVSNHKILVSVSDFVVSTTTLA